jgi:hypothetical protein
MDVFDILPEMLLLVGGKRRRSGNFDVGQGTPSVVLAVSLFGNAFEGVSTWAKSPRRRATKA